jgi:small subunit ribosomal protein S1
MDQTPDQPNQPTEQQAEWFENLLTQYDHQPPKAGEVMQATIIQVDKDGILVDVGIKRDVTIPAKDYTRLGQSFIDSLTPGDQIPVYVIGQAEDSGELQLSLSKGLENQVWEKAEKNLAEGTTLELDVLGHNRGGLIVRFESLRGFLPFSLVPELQGIRSPKRADEIKNSLVGKPILAKVTEVDRSRNRLIFSAEAAQKEKIEQRMRELKKGQVLTGRVVKILDFGAFVDLGGVDGLVHISQLSWKKARPADLVNIGDEIEVKVLDVDIERQRISLSRKALLPGPWQTISEELKAGDYVEGVVTRLVDFGAFVKLPMGVEGLIHTSQIGYSSSQNPQSAVKPGDRVLLKVLDVNPERKRVALSMRQVPLERQISWAMENVETSGTAHIQATAAEEPPTMGSVTPEENHAETNELPSTHTLVSDENQPAGDESSDSQSPQDSDTQ